jgi:hypothetical protein
MQRPVTTTADLVLATLLERCERHAAQPPAGWLGCEQFREK